jgi:methionyl-tRNA formyltransferase
MLKIIFLGTPEFALPSLKALLSHPEIKVIGVMTQPDRPSGRGQKLTPSPVKVLALENQIPVMQPERLRKEPEMIAWLRDLAPDFLVTAAFGQILSQAVLDIPKHGTVNVHASLLPAYRGPNPVQWAILNGDAKTGVTTMLTDIGIDTGAMLLKAETPIDPDEDALVLTHRLAELGGDILSKTLLDYAQGRLTPQPQDETLATHAPKLEKTDAAIDWSQPAQVLHNKIRGQQPWPGAIAEIFEMPVKILKTRLAPPGLLIQAQDGPLWIEKLQPPNKPPMSAKDWANGIRKK